MIIPPFLSQGDKVGITATAKKVDKELLVEGTEVIASWGLEVVFGKHLFDGKHFLAGKDADRLIDFNIFIRDPEIKAIFCARGGYGTGRILKAIVNEESLSKPKWIIGFSDLTLIHLKANQLGLSSIHGPMPAIFHKTNPKALSQLQRFLFEGKMNDVMSPMTDSNRLGQSEGVLTGGNLAMVCHSLGTPYEIETAGKILMLEEVDEALYRIDRMFWQLKEAGKLSELKGLVLGHFTLPENEESFDFGLIEIVNHWVNEFNYPVAFGFPFGHEPDNYPLPLNYPVRLDVSANGSRIMVGDGKSRVIRD